MRVAAFLLLSVLIGCSSKIMDNKTAEEKMTRSLGTDRYYIFMDIGRVGSNCGTDSVQGIVLTKNLTPTSSEVTLAAKALGYITIVPDGANFWKVELTEKGKSALYRKPYGETTENGCDYQQVNLLLATRELVKITGVTADENNPEVEYLWRWKPTEFGEALREGGAAFVALTPDQRSKLVRGMMGGQPDLPIPVPPENLVAKGVTKFKKFTDGWRPQR